MNCNKILYEIKYYIFFTNILFFMKYLSHKKTDLY